jgi:hypothetical protein
VSKNRDSSPLSYNITELKKVVESNVKASCSRNSRVEKKRSPFGSISPQYKIALPVTIKHGHHPTQYLIQFETTICLSVVDPIPLNCQRRRYRRLTPRQTFQVRDMKTYLSTDNKSVFE